MKPLYRGLLLAVLHAVIVLSLGGKLLFDRANLPRVWVKTLPYDPNLPVRGRYARLQLVVEADGLASEDRKRRALRAEEGRLIAVEHPDGRHFVGSREVQGAAVAVLQEAVAFFLPEHVPDPTVRAAGEELWVEVSVPKQGAPRPIRLGVKRGQGAIEPLPLD